MAFPSMSEFFIDPASMERLPAASDDRTKSSHKFPYDGISDDVRLLYHHYGELAWTQPTNQDIRVLFLVIRVPEKSVQADYYQLWAFEKAHIAGLASEKGKITTGSIRAYLGIEKESGISLKSKQIERDGVKFFEGTYQQVCKWIDSITGSGQTPVEV